MDLRESKIWEMRIRETHKIQIEWQGDTRNSAVVAEPAIEYNQMWN